MPNQAGDEQVERGKERAAARLREQAPEILTRWERHVRELLPLARDLDQETLYNNLHGVLMEIADAVTIAGKDPYAAAQVPAAKEHAEQRAGLEAYTLDLVILEYHLLRKVIVEVMDEGDPPSQRLVSVIHDCIDRAMQEAASHLVKTHAEMHRVHERARKTYVQKLLSAQEDERLRVSRELHDRSGQRVAAILLSAKALEPYCSPSDKASELLGTLTQMTQALATDLHELAVELRPTALDDLGLGPALAAHVEKWGKSNGVSAGFQSIGSPHRTMPPEAETTIYRAVQEALTNVLRHARATQVSVVLEYLPNEMRAIVEDNGCGFDAEAVARTSKRLGLLGLRERMDLVGGTVQIESSPGQGTTLFFHVPLTRVGRGAAGQGDHSPTNH